MTTALVLARPERRRILRELLAVPEPWTADQRKLYRTMLEIEFWDAVSIHNVNTDIAELHEKETFCKLVMSGVRQEQARELATESARECRANLNGPSEGKRERDRRRTFREAVTSFQGSLAVTQGLVEVCIVCGGGFHPPKRHRRIRQDAAYCSNACRQTAYRKRQRTAVLKTNP